MRNAGGYAVWVGGDLPTLERDTFTCKHCNTVVFVKPKMAASDMGGYCALCAAPICGPCTGQSCTPFEKKIDELEKKDYQRRQYEKVMGI